MDQPFAAVLDVAVEDGRVGAEPQFVGDAVDVQPDVGADLALEGLIVDAVVEDLRAALEDYPDAEALIVLTDGHPTAGTIIDPYKIIEKITEMNGFRRISINAVGLDSRNQEYEFLQTLAKRNFGKFGLMR